MPAGDRPTRLGDWLAVSGGKGIAGSAAAALSRLDYPIRLSHYLKTGIGSLPIREERAIILVTSRGQFRNVIR